MIETIIVRVSSTDILRWLFRYSQLPETPKDYIVSGASNDGSDVILTIELEE
jgi:hypothetical protein